MRKKQSNFSHKRAFSLFEFILFLAIFAIILAQALPRFSLNETLCFNQLRIKLSKANDAFLHLYTQSILASSRPSSITPILEELTLQKDKNCFFEYKKGRLLARIGKKTLPFEISPKDLKTKPKIYCSLSNELCRVFWQKTLKK